jgi:hypothetical protein
MSSETRLVRPFRDAVRTQKVLENEVTIRLFDAERLAGEIVAGSTIRVPAEQLQTRRIVLSGLNENLADAISRDLVDLKEVDDSNVELIIVASSSYLKKTEVLRRCRVSSFSSLESEMQLFSPIFECIHHGWEIIVVLVLSKNQVPKVGLPWRKGTWLAKVHFTVANPVEGIGFTPRPLTEEVRKRFSLHPQTTRYSANVDGVSVMDCSSLDEAIEYYVDEDLMIQLSSNPSSPFSVLEQTRIFLDAMSFVVSEISRTEEFADSTLIDLEGNLAHKILVLLAGDGHLSQDMWLSEWQQSPSKIFAGIEAHARLRDKLTKAVVGPI